MPSSSCFRVFRAYKKFLCQLSPSLASTPYSHAVSDNAWTADINLRWEQPGDLAASGPADELQPAADFRSVWEGKWATLLVRTVAHCKDTGPLAYFSGYRSKSSRNRLQNSSKHFDFYGERSAPWFHVKHKKFSACWSPLVFLYEVNLEIESKGSWFDLHGKCCLFHWCFTEFTLES